MQSISDLFLHMPWWMAALIIIGGVSLFFVGNRRMDKATQRIGLGLAALGALLILLHILFPSAQELMQRRTRQFVHAIDARDWSTAGQLLDADTVVGTASATLASGRDAILAAIRQACDQFGVHSVSIVRSSAERTETMITVSVDVMSNQEATQDRPIFSRLQFDYEQSGDDWVLEKIEVIAVGDQSNPNLNVHAR